VRALFRYLNYSTLTRKVRQVLRAGYSTFCTGFRILSAFDIIS
jgi:hypothetical protein